MSTLTFTDASVLTEVDLRAVVACEAEKCDQAAEMVVRMGDGCPVLACTRCYDHTRTSIHTKELQALCEACSGIQWWCPVCRSCQLATIPGACSQIIVSVVPL